MSEALSHTRVRELYAVYDQGRVGGAEWTQWVEAAEKAATWAQALTDEQLRTQSVQEALWSQRDFASAGASESLSVAEVLGDGAFIDQVIALRRTAWPPDASRRAEVLQKHFDEMTRHVRECLPGRTPVARLHRIFALMRPEDVHLCLAWDASVHVRKLLLGRKAHDRIAASVLSRARLREILGAEESMQEHMLRSTFLWWLHEHFALVEGGGTPGPSQDKPPEIPPLGDEPPLALWPPDRQYGWPGLFKGGVATLKVPLRECIEGRSFEDLQAAVHAELGPSFAADRYLRTLVAQLRRFGLLDEAEGRYTTTSAGEQLLEPGSPDVLIEALLVRVRGFANVLRHLQAEPRAVEQLQVFAAAFVEGEGGYDLWTRLVQWGHNVGVIEQLPDKRRRLSPLGLQWVTRLPAELPPAEAYHSGYLELAGGDDIPTEATGTHPSYAELWARFQTDNELASYVFTPAQVRSLYAAWTFHPRKRFVIISGLSGTGKTQLLRHAARLTCLHMGLDWKRHTAVVPVRPDWRDPTGLLGYYNALHAEPTFQMEPALELVLRAARNPGLPYFLILDEMNLARVERYFAPFLSTMETGDALRLHAEPEPVNGVPPTIDWPSNLRIGGTVNMDETTYPFSDKVLDRAFTLEFWDVDLMGFLARRGEVESPVSEALLAVQRELEPIRRHVGYRTAAEVLDWVAACRAADPTAEVASILDQAVFSKVLPRLRGSESTELTDALARLEKVCLKLQLSTCAAKLSGMKRRLHDTGVTSFWS